MNIAIVFAGGSGKRMKTHGLPKQFLNMKIIKKEIREVSTSVVLKK